MTRTIDVTNGESQYLTATVTEVTGKSLATATLKVGLGTDDAAPSSWDPPDVMTVSGAVATVSLLVDSSTPKGADLIMWVRVIDNPETYDLACATESVAVL